MKHHLAKRDSVKSKQMNWKRGIRTSLTIQMKKQHKVRRRRTLSFTVLCGTKQKKKKKKKKNILISLARRRARHFNGRGCSYKRVCMHASRFCFSFLSDQIVRPPSLRQYRGAIAYAAPADGIMLSVRPDRKWCASRSAAAARTAAASPSQPPPSPPPSSESEPPPPSPS